VALSILAGSSAFADGQSPAAAGDDVYDRMLAVSEQTASQQDEQQRDRNRLVRAGVSSSAYATNLSLSAFSTEDSNQLSAGKQLTDIEVRWDGSAERYSGIWYPVNGTVWKLIQGDASAWNSFIDNMAPKNGRYLDIEVGYFGGIKRYSAIFLEDGDDYGYALRSTNTDAQFQAYLDQYANEGRAIVDFEAYQDTAGNMRYAGLWVSDPNQPPTVLYYDLRSNEFSDLLDPLHGRVIDIERYQSSEQNDEIRYAIILTAYPGGAWKVRRGMSSSNLAAEHATIADSDTHIVDIESWVEGGLVKYGAVWGDNYKSLHEVAAVSPDTDVEPLPGAAATLVTNLEATGARIGIYAKNLTSGQSMSYREDEPFYLASVAKTAVHVRYWQHRYSGQLAGTETINYTTGGNTPDLYYTDCNKGGNSLTPTNFGQPFSLDFLDQIMMQISDNSATSMLVDDPANGLAWDNLDLNEWLSGLGGIGRGWNLLTGIQDLDRTIVWQGQRDSPDQYSLFLAPRGSLETYFRPQVSANPPCGVDLWGTLLDWVQATYPDATALPTFSDQSGHDRYFNMGLNTSTPRAFGRFQEALALDGFFDEAQTNAVLTIMTEGSIYRYAGLPSHIRAATKGGSKGSAGQGNQVCNDSAIYSIGPDRVSLYIATEDGSFNCPATTRPNFSRPIARAVLPAITPTLQDAGAGFQYLLSENIDYDDSIVIATSILNSGGGDAGSYDVSFFASSDTTIAITDHWLGKKVIPGTAGGATSPTTLIAPVPASLPPGTYNLGWIIDPVTLANPVGTVGEYLELPADIITAGGDPTKHYNTLMPNKTLTLHCAGTTIVQQGFAYQPGQSVTCTASQRIGASDIEVKGTAALVYRAPAISLGSGFSVALGGTFTATPIGAP